jgi:hypothetical protein
VGANSYTTCWDLTPDPASARSSSWAYRTLQYAANDDEARYCPTAGGQRRTTSIRGIGRIGIESIQLCLSCLKNLENCDVTDVASSELADWGVGEVEGRSLTLGTAHCRPLRGDRHLPGSTSTR